MSLPALWSRQSSVNALFCLSVSTFGCLGVLMGAAEVLAQPSHRETLSADKQSSVAGRFPQLEPAVAEAYVRGQYRDAVALQKSRLAALSRSSPEYKRGLVALTFLQDKTESPHQLVFPAREALDANQGNAVAAVNLAVLELVTGDYADAHKLAAEALGYDHEDWLAPVALAQALANEPGRGKGQAMAVLASAQNGAGGTHAAEKWRLMGETYSLLGEPAQAEKMFLKAARIAESRGEAVDDSLKESVLWSALASQDREQTAKYLSSVLASGRVKAPTLTLLAQKLNFAAALRGGARQQLARQIIAAAKRSCSGNADLFYSLGRAFESAATGGSGRLDAEALECYSIAAAIMPDEGKFVLAYAAQLVLAGEKSKAQVLLSRLNEALKLKEPSGRRVLVAGLVPAGLALIASGSPAYAVSRARLEGVKCYCRAGALAYILRHEPGVIFAYVPEGKGAEAVVIFDPGVNRGGAAKLWARMGAEARPVIIAPNSGSRPAGRTAGSAKGKGSVEKTSQNWPATVNTLPGLVEVATAAWEQSYEDPHPHYFFDPLPVRLP